jgi:hypothetical protein
MTQLSALTGKVQFWLYLQYCSTPLGIIQCVRRCVFLCPIVLPFCHRFQRAFRRCPAVCGRWVEARVIRHARLHGLLHRVVDVEDHALGAVFAVRLLVLAFDDGN